jgi:integrase
MVDLARGVAFIPGGETKTRKAIPVPLSGNAKELLASIEHDESVEFVFRDHLGRSPIGSPKTAWAKACKRAGIPGFRFHDLRHTWAAWHTMNGTPPVILKELGGWSSLAMVERYSALNPGHLSEWADNNSRTRNGTEGSGK